MNKLATQFLSATVALVALGLVGCDSNGSSDDNGGEQPIAERVSNFPADPFVAFVQGRPVGTGKFAFYSLRENAEVASSDSATTEWDIALRGTEILINGGTSGPGQGSAQVVDGVFSELTEAPESGWVVDGASGPAIPESSGAGWYNYNPVAMVVTPIPGRILLVRTADGKYAKISIVSYYQDAPASPTSADEARYYTFDYVLQPDGSRSFED